MFDTYKDVLKNLRNMQEQMWTASTESFPTVDIPSDLNAWQLQTLESMSTWARTAVNQSLELQQEWLEQWTGRADSKKLKPKFFAELSEEACDSMQRWLDNQNQLRDQWLQIMKSSTGLDALPGLTEWDNAVRDSVQGQMEVLRDWSKLADFQKLSTKELEKLFAQIGKSMKNSIATQQRLWSHWFKDLSNPSATEKTSERSPSKKGKAKQPRATNISKRAEMRQPARNDDLKRISGIGPGLEKKLNAEGILTLEQLAALTEKQIAQLEQSVIRFPGRIKRDKWVEQAQQLVSKS